MSAPEAAGIAAAAELTFRPSDFEHGDSTLQATTTPRGPISLTISWLAWPGLLSLCLLITGCGFALGRPALVFNVAYAFLAVSLYALERTMPHERSWNEPDGQTFANIAHTLLSKGVVQTLIVFSAVIGMASYVTPAAEPGYCIWPRAWPFTRTLSRRPKTTSVS